MTTITTIDGQQVDFDAAVILMEDEIRERLHSEMAPCGEQEFYDAYAAEDRARFGSDFVVN